MEFEGLLKNIVDEAKKKKKTIVLPESNDIRVVKAANIASQENIANIILIGNKDDIMRLCRAENMYGIDEKIQIVDPETSDKLGEFANTLYDLRKHKGMSLEQAEKLVHDNVYFATMMVKLGMADGMVSGAVHSTSDTLRPVLQIIKAKEEIKTVSAFFLMETKNREMGADGVFLFADCGLNPFPDEEQLCDITLASVKSFRDLVKKEPKVAFLSYSTKGSAKGEAIDKTVRAVNMIKNMEIDFKIDGELQLDAAIIPEVASLKAPDSQVAGQANILIFPDLQAGNIGYKLAQRFGNMLAIGPITQGLNKPVNDLSRGCKKEDIVGAIAITCLQAE